MLLRNDAASCYAYLHVNKDGAPSGSFLELERARGLCSLCVCDRAVAGCVLGSISKIIAQHWLRAPERDTSPVLAFLFAASLQFLRSVLAVPSDGWDGMKVSLPERARPHESIGKSDVPTDGQLASCVFELLRPGGFMYLGLYSALGR